MSKARRERADEVRRMQAQQAAAERRRRSLIVAGVVVVVLGIVVATWIGIQSQRSDETSGAAPAGATDGYGIVRGGSGAPVTVTLYEDFQCPACRAFEERLGPTLTDQVDAGDIRIEYRPIAFLDDASTTDYSSRASAAAACTLDDSGAEVWVELHGLLFSQQPAEGTAGLSDAQLADLAAEAGADRDAVSACQDDGTFDGWVAAATDQASKDDVNQTPTFLVDGERVTFTDDEDPETTLARAIDEAAQN